MLDTLFVRPDAWVLAPLAGPVHLVHLHGADLTNQR